MRVGFDHYTIGHRRLSAEQTLEFAVARGLEGVQFLEPVVIDPGLEPDRLAAFRAQADLMGLYLEVGLPSPNPIRRSREEGRAVEPAEHAQNLRPHLEAIAALKCRHARAYIGDRHDRFRTDVSWTEQCASTLQVIRHLADDLRRLGLRIAIETHADLTCEELLTFIDAAGPDQVGVTLDTGNLAMRLDNPVRAVERLAPFVLCTHIKDAVLAFNDLGLCWQARPVGSGILPITEMLVPLHRANPDLNLSIELHPRIYDLPIFDPSWLAFFPDLRPADLAAVVRLAALCEQRYAEGSLPRPEAVEVVPWEERDLDALARSAGFLKVVTQSLQMM